MALNDNEKEAIIEMRVLSFITKAEQDALSENDELARAKIAEFKAFRLEQANINKNYHAESLAKYTAEVDFYESL
jgi:hypothetical protein